MVINWTSPFRILGKINFCTQTVESLIRRHVLVLQCLPKSHKKTLGLYGLKVYKRGKCSKIETCKFIFWLYNITATGMLQILSGSLSVTGKACALL